MTVEGQCAVRLVRSDNSEHFYLPTRRTDAGLAEAKSRRRNEGSR